MSALPIAYGDILRGPHHTASIKLGKVSKCRLLFENCRAQDIAFYPLVVETFGGLICFIICFFCVSVKSSRIDWIEDHFLFQRTTSNTFSCCFSFSLFLKCLFTRFLRRYAVVRVKRHVAKASLRVFHHWLLAVLLIFHWLIYGTGFHVFVSAYDRVPSPAVSITFKMYMGLLLILIIYCLHRYCH